MDETHSKEMTKMKEDRKVAFLKLKDTLVNDHAKNMKGLTIKYQTEYKVDLANKRDFYEQQMAVSTIIMTVL